jgi:hypothetical protein
MSGPLPRRFLESLDRDIHVLLRAVCPDLESVESHDFFLPEGLLKGAGQFVAQAFASHGKEVPVGLAGGRLQVFAGPAADVEDVTLVIGEHGRRGVMLQNQLIGQGLETNQRIGDWTCLG